MAIFPWLAIFDLQNLYSYVKKPLKCTEEIFDDYTIVVPVYNNPSYIKNLDWLRKYKDKVVIASISNQSKEMDDFLYKLKIEGFRLSILDSSSSTLSYPATYYSIVKRTIVLELYDSLRKFSISDVKTKYVCVLDGDSRPETDIGKAVAVMERQGLDVASVKVLPSSKSNFIERMQWIEYNIAMRTRHYLPWLTSGACCIGKTSVFKEIMQTHSLYFSGGDAEIGILARMMKKKIGFIDFKVFTIVPNTLGKWFKQRINWFGGNFRISVINFDKYLTSPIFLTYVLGIVYLLLPLKWYELFLDLWLIPLMLLLYIPITFINWPVRDRYLFLFPLYGGFQALVLTILGFFRYFQWLIKYKKFGRISRKRPDK